MKIRHTVTIEIDESRLRGVTKEEARKCVKQEIDNIVGAMQDEDFNLNFLYDGAGI